MKIDSVSVKGKVTVFEISEKIFSSDINKKLIGQVLYSQIANSKPRLAKTKQRNEVIGSTAKIHAQKGTGNARHASKKAPLFVGGGVAHGPKGNVYKLKKINKKIKKSGIFFLLSQKKILNSLFIVDDFKTEIKKTKKFNEFLEEFKLKNSLIITDKNSKSKIIKSARNIPNLKIIDQEGTNAYDILKYKNVVFTTSSIKSFQERILK